MPSRSDIQVLLPGSILISIIGQRPVGSGLAVRLVSTNSWESDLRTRSTGCSLFEASAFPVRIEKDCSQPSLNRSNEILSGGGISLAC